MHKDQSGNVLFYILIAVALLAALSYTVAQSSRGGTSNLNKERSALYATEIIEYGNILTQAVSQIRLRGYQATEISFENNMVAGYTNANCTDSECKIFNINGGGISWLSPKTGVNDGNEWFITGGPCIPDIGIGDAACTALSGSSELVIFLPNVDKDICLQINKKLGINNIADSPPQEPSNAYILDDSRKWTGSWNDIHQISGAFTGLHSGCFEGGGTDPIPGTYHYYQVLISR